MRKLFALRRQIHGSKASVRTFENRPWSPTTLSSDIFSEAVACRLKTAVSDRHLSHCYIKSVTKLPEWSAYQENAAEFFRELGLQATTNAEVEGVRTHHDVDVLVTFQHSGLDLKWVVECKHWKSNVSKLHVLALRQIVDEVGADRGILLAENGFQSGAIEAAEKSDVSLTSIADLRVTASEALNLQKLLSFPLRVAVAHRGYWSISKSDRISLGIRTDVGDRGYLGQLVLGAAQDVLLSALADQYPPCGHYVAYGDAGEIANLGEAISWLEREVSHLEGLLNTPEAVARMRPVR